MDYMYGQLYKQIKEIEYKGRNSETTIVTVDQKTKTIRVDVKILSPEQLPKDEGNYVLLVEIDENGKHTLKWVSTQSTLDRIKELEDKTYKLTYNKDADTSIFDSNVTINKALNVEGNTTLNGKVTILNPPVDATDATNKQFVEEAIQTHFTNLNIENSTGDSSLRQKHDVNSVDYGAVASGENAVAFGGKRYDKLADTSLSPTIAQGNQSFAAGGSTKAMADFTTAFGKEGVAYQKGSFVAAMRGQAGLSEEEFNGRYWDSTEGVAIHGGKGKDSNGNILDEWGKPYVESYSTAATFGDGNKARGYADFVVGSGNISDGSGNFTTGNGNVVDAVKSFTGGESNEVVGDVGNAITYGQHLKNTGRWNKATFGQWNAENKDNILEVGGGENETTRRNIFEVGYNGNLYAAGSATIDGRVKIQTAPEDETDAVRLKEINDLDNVYVRRYKAAVINERRAYIVKPDGYDFTLPIHTTALGDDLPIRTSTGQLKATDGVADDDLVTIKQLNEGLNTKLDKVAITSGKFQVYVAGYDANGPKQLMVDLASDTSGNSIARRDDSGKLQAAAGTVADDVATFGQLAYINNVLQANINKKLDLVDGDTTIALKNNTTISYTSSATASTIMQRDSKGRVEVEDGINNKDAVNKGQLDTKLDLTGGTLTGNLTIQNADVEITKTSEGKGNLTVGGNLRVNGTTTTVDTETLAVKDNLIVANADNTELVNLSGLAIKTGNKDADENAIAYGILYDPATSADSVKLGLGSINKTTNEFTFKSATDANPVATRDDSTKLTDNHLLVWNSAKHTLIDANNLVNSITPASLGLNNFVLDGGEIA